MGRIDRKLVRIADELARLAEEERLAEAELEYHRHLHDDAVRDAAVSEHPLDREEAAMTGGDVARFERTLTALRARRAELERRRLELMTKL
jgi:hypothetical protein